MKGVLLYLRMVHVLNNIHQKGITLFDLKKQALCTNAPNSVVAIPERKAQELNSTDAQQAPRLNRVHE